MIELLEIVLGKSVGGVNWGKGVLRIWSKLDIYISVFIRHMFTNVMRLGEI